MTDVRRHQLATTGHTRLRVEVERGTITVHAEEDRREVLVEVVGRDAADVEVERDGDDLTVLAPAARGFRRRPGDLGVTVRLPAGSDLAFQATGADVEVTGRCGTALVRSGSGRVVLDVLDGEAQVETGSGDVRIADAAGDLDLRTGSGDLVVGRARAAVRASTGSGDVDLAHADGPVAVKTGSGDLHVGALGGDLTMLSGSGDTVVERVSPGRLTFRGASTDIHLGVPAGLAVWTEITSLSGDVSSTVPPTGPPAEGEPFLELRATTVSGDVVLRPV